MSAIYTDKSENQVQNTIENLYAVRAGLSVVSELSDEIRDREQEIRDIAEKRLKICLDKREVESSTKDAAYGLSDMLEDRESYIRHEINENYGARKKNLSPIFYLLLMMPITFIIALIFILKNKSYNDKIYKEIRAEAELKADKVIRDMQESIRKANQVLKEAEEHLQLSNDREAEIKTELNTVKQKAYSICCIYERALNDIYGSILKKTDYRNLDSVIYCLQTGRAGSVKEALLHIDGQANGGNRWTFAAKASESISAAGNSDIVNRINFTELVERLNKLGLNYKRANEESKVLEPEGSEHEKQSEQDVGDYFTENRLRQALVNKLSVSSEQLYGNWEYINRAYSDARA